VSGTGAKIGGGGGGSKMSVGGFIKVSFPKVHFFYLESLSPRGIKSGVEEGKGRVGDSLLPQRNKKKEDLCKKK